MPGHSFKLAWWMVAAAAWLGGVHSARAQPAPPVTPPGALVFDSDTKDYTLKPGETTAPFTFWVTNTHTSDAVILSITPSCGCTAARTPLMPWTLKPGEKGSFDLTMDLAGKIGEISKSVMVVSSSGVKGLSLVVHMPNATAGGGAPTGDDDRRRNMQMALTDRQIVFKGDCASCHAKPGEGKAGHQLFAAVCANCHESTHRAAMVPDLKALKHPTSADHWRKWIASGRIGSMMPAFSHKEGGPLSDAQIESLVTHLVATIPAQPPTATPAPAPALK